MKKMMIMLVITATLSACQPNYTGKYIVWGNTLSENNKECLKDNQIPYKKENGNVYIPEDAFDAAINTCS
ncbi:hypothetical protein ACSQ7W_15525 [Bacillus halotolerans]|uniref:Lipoprotein n=2 Tax=Bacillus halotolerans TaxID=260554 RepID=A0ABY7HYR7_9BACI|nr:hypothetical protein [Bacillus halotolerans]KUP29555.1 hypothetical protein AU384_16100 [Bacillus halotolerans]MBL4970328.1 hypothetical protein [Bacillus halotolerans]MBL4974339.1 hypothetical protein [Bacillus halotolerans]MCC2115208.1 hypothetical protein [Bacillus halotolerans]MCR6598000.1 hypothetical protein [Bacillus halotolerans]